MQFNPYLYFNGDCEEAFKFYEQLLGGKIEALFRHEGSPAASHVPPEWGQKILHARMTIGQTVLMASDAPPGHYHKPQGFSINIASSDPVDLGYQGSAVGDPAVAVTSSGSGVVAFIESNGTGFQLVAMRVSCSAP